MVDEAEKMVDKAEKKRKRSISCASSTSAKVLRDQENLSLLEGSSTGVGMKEYTLNDVAVACDVDLSSCDNSEAAAKLLVETVVRRKMKNTHDLKFDVQYLMEYIQMNCQNFM